MAVYTKTKDYHTKAHMGMIDVTNDFQAAVSEACEKHHISAGTITGFTTGGVAGLTTLEFEPGMVTKDLKEAMDVFSPYRDKDGRVIHYKHHDTWHDDNGSSHIKSALLSPFITIPFVEGRITIGPWQNLTLVECDTRDRHREIVFQVMGE
ncbi:YjbQ family protein [Lawsonibacter sp. OA9]|uniref:YjbQ family protein n=1 Tax=Oscillospiraceae TaxID=216572 RepID=UPI001F066F93|nr:MULTISPECIES: YjbQ family protein [Oscillospiraceae]MCH1978173.1 YjbQ family protein [Lawsonibacter sp. OA9]MCH1983720.1 YjbQ family protein [Ruminococcus sp. OA3]